MREIPFAPHGITLVVDRDPRMVSIPCSSPDIVIQYLTDLPDIFNCIYCHSKPTSFRTARGGGQDLQTVSNLCLRSILHLWWGLMMCQNQVGNLSESACRETRTCVSESGPLQEFRFPSGTLEKALIYYNPIVTSIPSSWTILSAKAILKRPQNSLPRRI